MKKILICGSRDFDRADLFDKAMTAWLTKHGTPNAVIEGCARGADSMAERWAETHLVTIEHYPAEWEKYGKAAGPRRNTQMLVEGQPDAVIAFSLDLSTSRGTANMVHQARAAGVPVWIPIRQKETV